MGGASESGNTLTGTGNVPSTLPRVANACLVTVLALDITVKATVAARHSLNYAQSKGHDENGPVRSHSQPVCSRIGGGATTRRDQDV